MRSRTALTLCILGLTAISFSVRGQEWNWQEIGKGVEAARTQTEMFDSPQSISVVRYKASKHRTMIVNDVREMADSTSALARRYGAAGAINGSYFNMKELTPTTLVIDDGVQEGTTVESEKNSRTDGVVAIKGKRRIIIGYDLPERCREALASGPVLLQDGRPARKEWPEDSFYTSRHPRTVMGTTADGWVYFIVVDGRFRGQAAGASIPEAVSIAAMFGLKDAINLDGGGSSTLWTESLGVLSHPSDNRKYDHAGQRIVPNAVVFK